VLTVFLVNPVLPVHVVLLEHEETRVTRVSPRSTPTPSAFVEKRENPAAWARKDPLARKAPPDPEASRESPVTSASREFKVHRDQKVKRVKWAYSLEEKKVKKEKLA